jgi:PhnB protein
MAVQLHAYINCNGNAREAIAFYQSVFGGEVSMNTFGEFASEAMPVAEDEKDNIMHAYLKGDNGIELMASDTPSIMTYQEGARITLSLSGDDYALLESYFNKLSEGGNVTMPLADSPWGDKFGSLTDKFGVNWFINFGNAS